MVLQNANTATFSPFKWALWGAGSVLVGSVVGLVLRKLFKRNFSYRYDGLQKHASGSLRNHTFVLRLEPGEDLRAKLIDFVTQNKIPAASIVTCVGSLTKCTLRMANSTTVQTFTGHFEIVSLVGTLSHLGSHLHMSISDAEGNVKGGHVYGECKIYTTAEICIMIHEDLTFAREACSKSGWEELSIQNHVTGK